MRKGLRAGKLLWLGDVILGINGLFFDIQVGEFMKGMAA